MQKFCKNIFFKILLTASESRGPKNYYVVKLEPWDNLWDHYCCTLRRHRLCICFIAVIVYMAKNQVVLLSIVILVDKVTFNYQRLLIVATVVLIFPYWSP